LVTKCQKPDIKYISDKKMCGSENSIC